MGRRQGRKTDASTMGQGCLIEPFFMERLSKIINIPST
jgi:hypothetical protein